jgi:hypothetical protein
VEAFQRLLMLRELFGKELKGYETVEMSILGLIDHAHAAAAELFENAVMRDRVPEHFLNIIDKID